MDENEDIITRKLQMTISRIASQSDVILFTA
jgi:hypothetical protein